MCWKIRKRGAKLYHHIYAWGNDRHPVFKERAHFQHYLSLLGMISRSRSIDVLAYALMEWHVHLFIFDNKNAIADFVMDLHGEYALFFNRNCRKNGHVFGERYNNKIVANTVYGMWLSRYIHRQAVSAKLVTNPVDYPWTSYRRYLDLEEKSFVNCNTILELFGPEITQQEHYQRFVLDSDDGPIDWGHRLISFRDSDYMVRMVSKELAVNASVIASPCGAKERNIRRKALAILIEKYRMKKIEAAKLLNVSRSTISKFNKPALP